MKEKIIIQHDERDCGAACLATIANYYGSNVTLPYTRMLSKTGKDGANLYGMVEAARIIGFESEALNGSYDDLMQGIQEGQIKFPFVAHIISESQMFHFIVVFGIDKSVVTIGDPAKGRVKISLDEFISSWTGYIVTFTQKGPLITTKRSKSIFTYFARLLKNNIATFIIITLFSVIIAAVGVACTFSFEIIIDNYGVTQGIFQEEHEHEHEGEAEEIETIPDVFQPIIDGLQELLDNYRDRRLSTLFIVLIALCFCQAIIMMIRSVLVLYITKKVDLDLGERYLSSIQKIRIENLYTFRTGEYISRLADIEFVRDTISTIIVTIPMDIVMVISCGIIIYLINPGMFLGSLTVLVIYTILLIIYRKPLQRSNSAVMQKKAEVQAFFKESIEGAETIRATSSKEYINSKSNKQYGDYVNSIVKNGLLSASQGVLANGFGMIGTMVILWIGFSMVMLGSMTAGKVITVYALLSFFITPIQDLIRLQPMLHEAGIAMDRLNDVFELPVESDDNADNTLPESLNCFEMRSVSFRYGNDFLTLDNVSIKVSKGEKIAIVGESGCGKTTLVKLFLRFYNAESGDILVDGNPIESYMIKDLRERIAYVGQDLFLFSDTIKNNVSLGIENITDEQLNKACELANLNEWIEQLPMGMETPIDENGSNLSCGQKQRIAIARALLKEPQLLILDEATSNLDSLSEQSIRKSLNSFVDGKACIIIAHRLATIMDCDRIYVMKNGTIVECGTHNELLANGKYYSELWEKSNCQ